MAKSTKDEAVDSDATLLRIALDARQFELDLFWRRALFFWGFIAVAFVALGSLYDSKPRLAIAASCFGTFCSLCWHLVNRGSKYWYEEWEQKVEDVGGPKVAQLFRNAEPRKDTRLWSGRRFSPSRVAIALSEFVTAMWVCILAYQFIEFLLTMTWSSWRDMATIAFVCATLVNCVRVFWMARGKDSSVSGPQESDGLADTDSETSKDL